MKSDYEKIVILYAKCDHLNECPNLDNFDRKSETNSRSEFNISNI